MSTQLTQSQADQIDSALGNIYPRLGGGELTQLAKLFGSRGLLNALRTTLRPPKPAQPPRGNPPKVTVTVQLAWLDKRPYALMNGEKHKVEIADVAVFHFNTNRWNTGSSTTARCLLLQAKAVKTPDQLSAPKVCLNPPTPKSNTTTQRELLLLSKWPKFDMYLGSNSKTPLATNIQIPFSTSPPPMGWFIGTPMIRPSSSQMGAWVSPWMCAPAKQDHACDETLGSLLCRHFSGGQSSQIAKRPTDAGAPFSYNPTSHGQGNPTSSDWDRLCIEMMGAVRGQIIPPHLTNGTPQDRLQAGVMYSIPVWPALRVLAATVVNILMRFSKKRMPILVVSRVFDERIMP
ncbi:hypothetical protein SAMN03159512_04071 [Pseudomonas sp. NFR09]|jgi:hypothetical protein|uniref:hypothetical protein n=1 Tax=Pseudomonas sp. NFR09 TaxID=1566249 RepID=UPI0008BC1804|nr:hypothetical protein [Pseudomonas sp. NFR09]SET91483.1 hypothetical protein SAMN03159512_04071 [Pseudomonas sp. NFR09]